MILCITEKPSVGKDIARILGADTSHPGYMEGPEYCVTWTFGHLCTLKAPNDYTPAWRHWALSTLPMIPQRFSIKLIEDKGIEQQFNVIKWLITQADEVINCGDAGQEGELIQRWVMQKAGCNKPVKRLWINSLTDEAIREGFRNLRTHESMQPLYEAGLCRAIGDWVLGMNATRLYTLKYASDRQILSIGRVQTPTLAIVVGRQLEIDNFVAADYWELKTVYRDTLFSATCKAFKTEQEAQALATQISSREFQIDDVARKKGKEAPPKLFDLTSLQVECNRKFGLGADATLKTIQSLYEKKLTTYPRVDTTYLSNDIYPKCGAILNGMTQYGDLLTPLRGKKLKKSSKVFDSSKVTDHHAIIPTGQPLPPTLADTERKVFDLIARRFIAAFYPDCTFEQTSVKGHAGKTGFKTSGKVIMDPGWRTVFQSGTQARPETAENEEEGDNRVLPAFTPGESGPHTPKVVKKTTQPPKYYTEGTLLKAMETAGATVDDEDLREALKANGIGRPSTRAAIIETLYKRGYIRKERKSLRATEAGIQLISLIKEELLKSAKLTGIWEGKLREIERGTYSATEFIDQIKKMIWAITESVMLDTSNRRIAAQQPPDAAKPARTRKRADNTGNKKKGAST